MLKFATFQRWFKGRIQRLHYLRVINNMTHIQYLARCWLTRRSKAVIILQRAVRGMLRKHHERRRNTAAVVIQVCVCVCVCVCV